MPKDTTLNPWWSALVNTRTKRSITLCSQLLGVSTRTITRWSNGELALPRVEHALAIRKLAGKELLEREDCPWYLKSKGYLTSKNK